jgi:hypothetical protein
MTRPTFDSCRRRGARPIALAALLTTLLAATGARAGSDLPEPIAKQVESLVAGRRREPLAKARVEELCRTAAKQHGSVKPLLAWLAKTRGDGRDGRSQVLAELEVHVAARQGDLKRASKTLTSLLEIDGVGARRPDLRLWQARLYDALGDIDKARDVYKALMSAGLSEADQQMVRLRLALMGLLGQGGAEAAKNAKELVDLAKASGDAAFQPGRDRAGRAEPVCRGDQAVCGRGRKDRAISRRQPRRGVGDSRRRPQGGDRVCVGRRAIRADEA